MYEVENYHMRRAVNDLRQVIEDKNLFKHYADPKEVYPGVTASNLEDSFEHLEIRGFGVSLLAFLMQESMRSRRGTECNSCAKQKVCRGAFAYGFLDEVHWGSFIPDRIKRKQVEDILQFLARRYPELYIPQYETELGLSWIDLLIDIAADGDGFYPRIGVAQPKDDCKDFEQEQK